ncbi:hypothetical protein D3C80_1514480 [compost metagenome]
MPRHHNRLNGTTKDDDFVCLLECHIAARDGLSCRPQHANVIAPLEHLHPADMIAMVVGDQDVRQ